ncbi:hypothetical protein EDC96DRAFT_573334 [Choanephora cucurbitarum]|nr:hypothetical protein EDC96DRAFT_573334 [Choanephora cucurbitarum]
MSEKRKREEEEEEEEEFQRPIKQENLEAAKVYAEFVASFEEPKPYQLGTTSFVKSGTLMPKDPVNQYHGQTPAASSPFKPMPFVKAGESPMQTTLKVKHQLESLDDEDDALVKLKSIPKAQKKRNLDSFLEEIKKGQEVRTRNDTKHGIAPMEGDTMGSFDEGNPNTTNLYVGNINPTTTEAGLCQEFGKFGPIASVKIMWPRTQEEKDKGNNCGFVSFMTRKDAAEAIRGLDGKELHGFTLRVGWGKAVPLPATPFFVLDKKVSLGQAKTGLPFNAQIYPGPPGVNSRPRAEVHVTKPVDVKLMRVMHRMIERVLKHGPLFEAIIMDKELNNPTFKFLFDNSSPEHIYYRWRLYSLSQGDTKSRWRDEPFQMFEGGPWWIPPELPLLDKEPMFDTDDELADQDNVAKGTLGQIAKQRLGGLIREVTFQRGTIARAMSFAIDHSDAASEVVDVLSKSILIPDIPFSVKLARLYLVSDILHNSSVHVSNAWKYRKEFEAHLPVIFDHFNSIYRSIGARLKAEQVRKYISSIIHVWENWMIFPKYYTDQLSDIFLKKEKAPSITQPEDVDGEDIDGEPMDDVDGEPIEDVDGEPMEDVDGEPIQDNEEEEDFTQVNDMFS